MVSEDSGCACWPPCTHGSEISEAASLSSKAVLTARAGRDFVLMCGIWVVQKAKQLSGMQEEEAGDPVKDLVSDEDHHNVFFRGIFVCWLWKGVLLQWFLILRNLSLRNGEMALHWVFSTIARTLLLCSCGRICWAGEHWVYKDNGEHRWALWSHYSFPFLVPGYLPASTLLLQRAKTELILLFQLAWTHFLGIIQGTWIPSVSSGWIFHYSRTQVTQLWIQPFVL